MVSLARRIEFSSGENATLLISNCRSNLRNSSAELGCHNLAVVSSLPVRIKRPDGEYATDTTVSLWPENVRNRSPVLTSHNRAVNSVLPVSTNLPSGENLTERSVPLCPLNVCKTAPDTASHRYTLLSSHPVNKLFPSWEKATECTEYLCGNLTTSWPVAKSQIRADVSRLPVAMY